MTGNLIHRLMGVAIGMAAVWPSARASVTDGAAGELRKSIACISGKSVSVTFRNELSHDAILGAIKAGDDKALATTGSTQDVAALEDCDLQAALTAVVEASRGKADPKRYQESVARSVSVDITDATFEATNLMGASLSADAPNLQSSALSGVGFGGSVEQGGFNLNIGSTGEYAPNLDTSGQVRTGSSAPLTPAVAPPAVAPKTWSEPEKTYRPEPGVQVVQIGPSDPVSTKAVMVHTEKVGDPFVKDGVTYQKMRNIYREPDTEGQAEKKRELKKTERDIERLDREENRARQDQQFALQMLQQKHNADSEMTQMIMMALMQSEKKQDKIAAAMFAAMLKRQQSNAQQLELEANQVVFKETTRDIEDRRVAAEDKADDLADELATNKHREIERYYDQPVDASGTSGGTGATLAAATPVVSRVSSAMPGFDPNCRIPTAGQRGLAAIDGELSRASQVARAQSNSSIGAQASTAGGSTSKNRGSVTPVTTKWGTIVTGASPFM